MVYDATVVKAFLASPGDVADERRVAREVIHEWNAVHSEERRLVILPVGWDSHAVPEMGQRPQEIINSQVLHSCDFLVGIFWNRLGTPTGDSPSGTVEEIRRHVQAGKLAALYFSRAPIPPDSLDLDQYKALLAFRKECEQAGLLETYGSVDEFRTKFARQLTQRVIRSFRPSPAVLSDANARTPAEATPALSEEARELLRVAVTPGPLEGSITRVKSNAGVSVLAGGRDFTDPRTPRAEARWTAALEELENAGLVNDLHGTRYEFQVTQSGYELSDTLNVANPS
jgi:hypothetical protein